MTTTLLPYRDPALPLAARAGDLLGRMTRAEKIAQLGSFWAFEVIGEDGLDVDTLAAMAPDGIGHITRLAGSTNLQPDQVAAAANGIQRQLVEGTRLGIPAIIHEECLHGLIAWGAPCFQQSIGAAAAFDPDLVTAVAATIRKRMLLTGARHALAPVFDIARDPRWGRIEETYGEDPYLATELGCAYVEALQGPDLASGVLATAKHMVGHGLAEGGRNQAPAHLGPRELRDEQLVPFEAAVRHAGIGSVMPAYCDVDGVPCHASRELLETILRGEWGFDGIVASDYMGIEMLSTAHRLTTDLGEAARLALVAGVDAELPRTVAFGTPLVEGLADGRIDEALLDVAVDRVLRMKFRLGLFERPYLELPTDAAFEKLAAEESQAARALAERSIVLLENRGVLPLAPDLHRIAVVGPIADSARDLLGDYSHLVHMETLREMRSGVDALGVIGDGAIGGEHGRNFEVGDELSGRRTIVDALRAAMTGAEVVHARGTGISSGTDEELASAVALARDADIAIVVLGERSGLTDEFDHGRVPRSRRAWVPGQAAGAPRGRGRDGDACRAGRRQRPPTGSALGRRALRRDPARLGARRCRPRRRRPGAHRAGEPRRQAAGLHAAPCRPAPAHVPPPPHRGPLPPQGGLRRLPWSRRSGRSGSAARTRPSRSTRCAWTGRSSTRPATSRRSGSTSPTPAPLQATRSSSSMSAMRRRRSPARSASYAASGDCTSSPASAGR